MNRRTETEDALNKQIWALQTASAELEALSHLFRLKRRDDAPPVDMERINWGLSLLLVRTARRVHLAASRIEDAQLEQAKRA